MDLGKFKLHFARSPNSMVLGGPPKEMQDPTLKVHFLITPPIFLQFYKNKIPTPFRVWKVGGLTKK